MCMGTACMHGNGAHGNGMHVRATDRSRIPAGTAHPTHLHAWGLCACMGNEEMHAGDELVAHHAMDRSVEEDPG